MTTSYFLRRGDDLWELEEGETLVGRSSEAAIILDGHLASRRHCAFLRTGRELLIRDLDSKNGVLVNGHRIQEEVIAELGDRITVGGHEFVVVDTQEQQPSQKRRTRAERVTLQQPVVQPSNDETRSGSVFDLFVDGCQRALDRGDLVSAEGTANNLFVSIRAALLRGKDPGAVVDRCVQFGLTLAEATDDRRWVERIVSLYSAAHQAMPKPVADSLMGLLERRVFAIDLLHSYLAVVRPVVGHQPGPAQDLDHLEARLHAHAGDLTG